MGYRLPFFPLHAAETLSDGRFQVWTLEERGAWLTLICHNWNDEDVPAAPSDLARLLHVTPTDAARIMSSIGDRFVPVPGKPGRMWSPRLERERDRATTISRKRAEVGKKGAASRWHPPEHGKGMPLPCHEVAKPAAMESACQIQSQSQSQEQEAVATAAVDDALVADFREKLGVRLARPSEWFRVAAADKVAETRGLLVAELRRLGVDRAVEVSASRASKEGKVPQWFRWYLGALQDAGRNGARGPQPVSQDFSETLEDVARRLEGKHGRTA